MRMRSDFVARAPAAALGLLVFLVACAGDHNVTGPPPPPPNGLVVSNPLPFPAAAARPRAMASAAASQGSSADTMVYVSLAPGTAPTGMTAIVRNRASGATAGTMIRNGGFDPVQVTAKVGDTVETAVRDAAGAIVFEAEAAVSPIRRLVVIRTEPGPGRRDQPLNGSLVVVFSEPVAGASLNASSVRLQQGASAVAGTVSLLEGNGTIVTFTPAAPLEPNTDYTLVVTTAVTDLDGDPLAAAVTVSFTTGQSSIGPPASISVSPDTIFMTGGTYQLTATVRDAAGNVLIDQPVAWSSSDPTGLTVSTTGVVTALATGSYNVTATSAGFAALARVVVTAGPPASVSVSPTPASVGAQGDTIVLSASVRDARGRLIRFPSVTWASSDQAVATVAPAPGDVGPEFATVTGVSLGDVTVTATSGTAHGTASVTVVTPVPAASVTVSPAAATLLLQMTQRLSATVRDANGKILGRPVAWTTDPGGVATVDATGLLRAVAAGSTSAIATSGGVSGSATVTVVALRVASVVAGHLHSCALTTDGAAYCWGNNEYGELGDGSKVSRLVPTAVAGGLKFSALSAWAFHTCGVTTSGAAYCWGDNSFGRLGNGSTISSAVPVPVSGGLTFSSVVTGSTHTCGLTPSGAAYCWGGSADGERGDGSDTSSSVPVAVTGGLTFSALSTWGIHTCGLTTNGAAYCWGSNFAGELGDGSTTSSAVPVAVSGGYTFTAISAGRFHTCGITTSGTTYCWGDNGFGQLGDGTTTMRPAPVAVSGGLAFVTLAGGNYHTCGLTASGAAYCWGRNSESELGDGGSGISHRAAPTGVAGGLNFSAISAGGFHSCALSTTGTAYCWGYNAFAELGDGSGADSAVPVRVLGQP
jgi:alpha-tubulin suppressor-like RCC1 family protein